MDTMDTTLRELDLDIPDLGVRIERRADGELWAGLNGEAKAVRVFRSW